MNVHQIELCGVVFSGEDGPLSFSRLIGWYDGADIRGSVDAVPGAHGAYERPNVFRNARTVTLEAELELPDHGERLAEIARLSSALSGVGDMRVSDESGVWSRRVEVHGFTVDESHSISLVTVVVDVVAPDPVRYRDLVMLGPVGLPVREGGLVLPSAFPWNFGTSIRPLASVVNDGSVPVYPVVTVRGSADSLVAHGGPRRIEFGAFDGELVIDNRERRAWLNGGDVTRQLLRRDWQSVPAGVTQDFFFDAVDASPETTMTVEYRIGAW